MAEAKVFVLIEQRDGELLKPSLEALGEALDLADASESDKPEIVAVLLLANSELQTQNLELLKKYGADKIIAAYHPTLAHFDATTWTQAVQAVVSNQQNQSSIVLLAATPNGRELAPRLAVTLGAGFVADSVRVRREIGSNGQAEIAATVPLYGDRVYSQQHISGAKAVVSFRPGARGLDRPGERGYITPEIVDLPLMLETANTTQHLEFVPPDPRTVHLTEADAIVCGGAGVGKEHFNLMWDLADQIGAAVGGTRVAVDKGWLEWDRQIGQTGQVVAPRLFVSCGTSGAGQHITGMKDSRTVIVINSDRNAPMFSLADIGVVGDVNEIIPNLLKKLKR